MSIVRSELLRGTLDLMVLKTLTLEPMHGWGIAQRIEHLSGDVFEVNQGSLYPALRGLQRRGWVTSRWRRSEHNRRARFYTITTAGCRQLAKEEDGWAASSAGVERVLRLALEGG